MMTHLNRSAISLIPLAGLLTERKCGGFANSFTMQTIKYSQLATYSMQPHIPMNL